LARFSNNKDLVAIDIALVAIIISLTTVLTDRHHHRAMSFPTVQELMLYADLQHGRILVYEADVTGKVPPDGSAESFQIIRARAVFDTVDAFVRRGIVARRWFLDY
jgi:hypothetical protein